MSSLSKASSSKNMTNDSPEESGWTTYFEDFFNNRNIEDQECTMSFTGVDHSSSSLVSDAASFAVKKLTDSGQVEDFPMNKNGNKSNFKKRKKIKTALVDDTLEDTASSPVNSPKVVYKDQLYREQRKEEIDFSQEKGNNSSGQRDEGKEFGLDDGKNSECSELKRRGLCLVPLSMLVKYLG